MSWEGTRFHGITNLYRLEAESEEQHQDSRASAQEKEIRSVESTGPIPRLLSVDRQQSLRFIPVTAPFDVKVIKADGIDQTAACKSQLLCYIAELDITGICFSCLAKPSFKSIERHNHVKTLQCGQDKSTSVCSFYYRQELLRAKSDDEHAHFAQLVPVVQLNTYTLIVAPFAIFLA